MSLKDDLQKMKFDTRMVDLGLQQGHITEKELKKHLESLPDSESKARPLNIKWEDRGSSDSDGV